MCVFGETAVGGGLSIGPSLQRAILVEAMGTKGLATGCHGGDAHRGRVGDQGIMSGRVWCLDGAERKGRESGFDLFDL